MFGTCFRNGARTLCHADDAACRGGLSGIFFFLATAAGTLAPSLRSLTAAATAQFKNVQERLA